MEEPRLWGEAGGEPGLVGPPSPTSPTVLRPSKSPFPSLLLPLAAGCRRSPGSRIAAAAAYGGGEGVGGAGGGDDAGPTGAFLESSEGMAGWARLGPPLEGGGGLAGLVQGFQGAHKLWGPQACKLPSGDPLNWMCIEWWWCVCVCPATLHLPFYNPL